MILVTGATGHLGANLVRRLLEDGEPVRVLLREGTATRAVDGLGVERVWGDIRDYAKTLAAVRGCRRVYHCAANVSSAEGRQREIYETNVLGTRHVLRAALESGVSRVAVTGSFSAVGHDPTRPVDETVPVDPFQKLLPYQRSKIAVEHECLKAMVDGLDVVIATSCAILGPNDFHPSRMGQLLLDFANGRLRAYIPGGSSSSRPGTSPRAIASPWRRGARDTSTSSAPSSRPWTSSWTSTRRPPDASARGCVSPRR
jgi:nucleoside-diphosphate-sugar epimerase